MKIGMDVAASEFMTEDKKYDLNFKVKDNDGSQVLSGYAAPRPVHMLRPAGNARRPMYHRCFQRVCVCTCAENGAPDKYSVQLGDSCSPTRCFPLTLRSR